jgi:hypothetical protein
MNFSESEKCSDLSNLAKKAGRTDDAEESIKEIDDIK